MDRQKDKETIYHNKTTVIKGDDIQAKIVELKINQKIKLFFVQISVLGQNIRKVYTPQ